MVIYLIGYIEKNKCLDLNIFQTDSNRSAKLITVVLCTSLTIINCKTLSNNHINLRRWIVQPLCFILNNKYAHHNAELGAQWLSGRVLDSKPRGHRFEPHWRHCVVVLEQNTFILA